MIRETSACLRCTELQPRINLRTTPRVQVARSRAHGEPWSALGVEGTLEKRREPEGSKSATLEPRDLYRWLARALHREHQLDPCSRGTLEKENSALGFEKIRPERDRAQPSARSRCGRCGAEHDVSDPSLHLSGNGTPK